MSCLKFASNSAESILIVSVAESYAIPTPPLNAAPKSLSKFALVYTCSTSNSNLPVDES